MKSFIFQSTLNSRFAFVEEQSPVRYVSRNSKPNMQEAQPKPDSWRQKSTNSEPSYTISTNRRSPKSLRLKSWFGLSDPDDPRWDNFLKHIQ